MTDDLKKLARLAVQAWQDTECDPEGPLNSVMRQLQTRLAEDFSDHPRSVTDLRSDRTGSAATWTPRDALIDVLRDLDSGNTKADALVVVYRSADGKGGTSTNFRNAAPDVHVTLGLLTHVQYRMLSD